MTAFVLPDLNQKTLDDLRERVSKLSDLDLTKLDLSKIEMPALQDVGKTADQAIDRLLGRSRTPMWPWVAAGIGLIAVVGVIAAWFTFLRRPAMTGLGSPSPDQTFTDDLSAPENEGMTSHSSMNDDLRTEELVTSLRTTPYPIEEA